MISHPRFGRLLKPTACGTITPDSLSSSEAPELERVVVRLLLVLTLPGLLTSLPIRARRNLDRGEGPTNTMIKEPDLGAAARKPLERWIDRRDGPSLYPVPQTNWDTACT